MDLREVNTSFVARHPWERARARFFLGRLVSVARHLPERGAHLDVGSGDGWLANYLVAGLARRPRAWVRPLTCWDVGYADPAAAPRLVADGARVTRAATRPAGTFAVATLLDVLEHVRDAQGLLASVVADNLMAGGLALISVPAWPCLYGDHDAHLRHLRRYTPAAGRRLVTGAKLRLLAEGGLFHSLLLPRALEVLQQRLIRRRRPCRGVGAWTGGRTVTAAVDLALRCDTATTEALGAIGASAPGLSWWALAQKPAAPPAAG